MNINVDEQFMQKALALAQCGITTTTPNPRVGCVLVRDGLVVGEGWHARAGEPHAEIVALRAAGERARGATAYVTLEPCSHYGRTPPCVEALITAGVVRVVAAMSDSNPLVAGRGFERLRAVGIEVVDGVCEEQARYLNRGFVSRMTRQRPWITVKAAASLDGKTALANGISQWITGEAARQDVQQLRAEHCAILTGVGTVRADNPRLTVRTVACSRQPVRVVLDSGLRTSPEAAIYRTEDAPTVLVTTCDVARQHQPWLERGVSVWVMPMTAAGQIDLAALMVRMAEEGWNYVMTEAGMTLNGALLQQGWADEVVLYLAPMFLGDQARSLFAWPPLSCLSQRIELEPMQIRRIGEDWRIHVRVVRDGRADFKLI